MKDLDKNNDTSDTSLSLTDPEKELIYNILESNSKDDLQYQIDLFNLNQSKKNALRVIKLNKLLANIEDQVIERFKKRPDQISNKDLLDFLEVISNQVDKAQKSANMLEMNSAIKVTNQKNELNINVGPALDRDSKERVLDAVKYILDSINKKDNSIVIDSEQIETEDMENDNEDIE